MFSPKPELKKDVPKKKLEVHLDVYTVVKPRAVDDHPMVNYVWDVAVIYDGAVVENYPTNNAVQYFPTEEKALAAGRSVKNQCVEVYRKHFSHEIISEVDTVEI